MKAALMLVVFAGAVACAGETLLGLGAMMAPPVEVAGQRAMVFIPRLVVGADLGGILLLGELWGDVYREEGRWPHALSLSGVVSACFEYVTLGPTSVGAGLFFQPTLTLTSNPGASVGMSSSTVAGVRALSVLLKPIPSAFFLVTLDLHPSYGIVGGLAGGVRF